ncbi:DUF1642 domain-containing protein [Sporosarcina sp. ITBMC105]
MTIEKVVVPREVAEAVETLRKRGYTDYSVLDDVISTHGTRNGNVIKAWLYDTKTEMDVLMRALVVGYTVEKTSEEKVRDYYKRIKDEYDSDRLSFDLGILTGVSRTLDILDIKIEGVNAE